MYLWLFPEFIWGISWRRAGCMIPNYCCRNWADGSPSCLWLPRTRHYNCPMTMSLRAHRPIYWQYRIWQLLYHWQYLGGWTGPLPFPFYFPNHVPCRFNGRARVQLGVIRCPRIPFARFKCATGLCFITLEITHVLRRRPWWGYSQCMFPSVSACFAQIVEPWFVWTFRIFCRFQE